jgi:membrane-associated protein
MDLIKHLIDFIIHIDVHLNQIIRAYGMWTYAILTLIVFIETGVVVMPFLPGDSLLFAAGAFAARGSLNVALVFSCSPPQQSWGTTPITGSGDSSPRGWSAASHS